MFALSCSSEARADSSLSFILFSKTFIPSFVSLAPQVPTTPLSNSDQGTINFPVNLHFRLSTFHKPIQQHT